MRPHYLGDSYDIVKQSLLRWLGEFSPWVTHPMFTEPAPPGFAESLECLLGTPLVNTDLLTPASDRGECLGTCAGHHSVFLDPNTGVKLRGRPHPDYLTGDELVALVRARPQALTMVFDQSLQRGNERSQIESKLSWLADRQVQAFAYVSHAAFIVATNRDGTLAAARQQLLDRSKLPAARLTPINVMRGDA